MRLSTVLTFSVFIYERLCSAVGTLWAMGLEAVKVH